MLLLKFDIITNVQKGYKHKV